MADDSMLARVNLTDSQWWIGREQHCTNETNESVVERSMKLLATAEQEYDLAMSRLFFSRDD